MLGDIIRSVRKQKHTTLKEISEKSGLSIGYISQIERNQTEPSLSTLRKISQALDVPTYYFMKQDEDCTAADMYEDEYYAADMPVEPEKKPVTEQTIPALEDLETYVKIGSNQIVTLSLPNSNVKYYLMSPMPTAKFVPQSLVIRFELDPQSADGDFPVQHPSEEILIVEEGEIVVETPDETVTLLKGESVILKSNIPHTIYNKLDTVSVGLSIFTPAIWFPIARNSQ